MSDASRVVMFVGAGASREFGGPLTNEILPKIVRGIHRKTLFGKGQKHEQERKTLQRLLEGLMPGIMAVDQRYVLITEVLSLVDYMLLSAFVPAPMTQAQELQEGRMLLERAILDVVTGKKIYDRTDDATIPSKLRDLASWMYGVGKTSSFALVSTNYDEIIENALYWCFIDKNAPKKFDGVNESINFGLSWRDLPTGRVFNPPPRYQHSVLKLHGSVDWVKCDLCGWIVCNDDYFFERQQPHHLAYLQKIGADYKCNCGHGPLRPVIIAPSLVRDIRDINILAVWKAAFEELRTADQWFMIGYSLPIDDYAIRAMLIRALQSRGTKDPPKVDVYQHGNSKETEARYRAFFGPQCTYHRKGMREFIARVVDQRMFLAAAPDGPPATAHALP